MYELYGKYVTAAILIAGALFHPLPATAQDFVVTKKAGTFACLDRARIDHVLELFRAGDREAGTKAYLDAILSGRCRLIQEGQRVYWSGPNAVRMPGQTETYFTEMNAVAPAR